VEDQLLRDVMAFTTNTFWSSGPSNSRYIHRTVLRLRARWQEFRPPAQIPLPPAPDINGLAFDELTAAKQRAATPGVIATFAPAAG
jgi:hypothetical protein